MSTAAQLFLIFWGSAVCESALGMVSISNMAEP